MLERSRLRCLVFVLPLIVAAWVIGCGQKRDDAAIVLAQIGDRQVTAEYFKDRLGRLKQVNLPRGEDGQVLDMAGSEGKRRFLEIIIDKELMVAKALQLGYLQDEMIESARNYLTEYNGMIYFWQDQIGNPSRFVSDADLDHYYSRLGEKRLCDYLITDTREEALAARQAVMDGAPWSEAVARYHYAPAPDTRRMQTTIAWGHFRDDFQRPVFAVEKGGISDPIETEYGWWLVRVQDVIMDSKPELETIKTSVLASIAKRKEQQLRQELIDDAKRRHNFMLDEEVLRVVLAGLPEGEQILDETTKQPIPREQLKPLDVASTDYDKVLLSYDLSAGPITVTVLDYKTFFERQSVFDRPKKHEGLGSLRTKLTNSAERAIMIDDARQRGYWQDPRVEKDTFAKIEEMLVERVHRDLVTFEEYVSAEEIQSYYDENRESFRRPERRTGTLLRCQDRDKAEQAGQAWRDGALAWRELVQRFGINPDQTEESAKVGPLAADPAQPLHTTLFALGEGAVSEPIELPEGWAVVRLDGITPPELPGLEDVRDTISQIIKAQRQDDALRALLDKWSQEFGVTVYEEHLQKMPSWQEAVDALTAAAQKPLGA